MSKPAFTQRPLRPNGTMIMLGSRNIGRAFVTPETDGPTALANAILWSASWEMYEALKILDKACSRVNLGALDRDIAASLWDAQRAARTALAKAVQP